MGFVFTAVMVCVTVLFQVHCQDSLTSVSTSVSKGPTYKAKMSLKANDKDCVEKATVKGNGVSDTLELPCTDDMHGREVVNQRDKLVIGGEPGDSVGILGSKPNTLVVMEGDKCVEKYYPPGGPPGERILDDSECVAARKELQDTKKEAKEEKEKEKEQFDNIGKGLGGPLIVDAPKLDIADPFKLLKLGFK